MPSICLYFRIHRSYRLKKHEKTHNGNYGSFIDTDANAESIKMAADLCYRPVTELLLSMIENRGDKFNCCFCISGIAAELMDEYCPDVIKQLQNLAATGRVDFTGETYYKSLSSLYSADEFAEQAGLHKKMMQNIFGITPAVFRNTEFFHSNNIVKQVKEMGYTGLLCEGNRKILKGRSPGKVYKTPGLHDFSLLLRNAALSDNIAFHFDNTTHSEYPFTAEKFASHLKQYHVGDEVVNILLDYETFGLHKKKETGILQFLEYLPVFITENTSFNFKKPSEVLRCVQPSEEYDTPFPVSWDGDSRFHRITDNNTPQNNSIKKIFSLENAVKAAGNDDFMRMWRLLHSSDYFSDMHPVGESNEKTYTAAISYENYMNILYDFEVRLIQYNLEKSKANGLKYTGSMSYLL